MALETTPPSVPTGQSTNGPHSFLLAKGRCFRKLKLEQFGTVYCERPVTWKGQWRDIKGEVWMVEACERHRPDAENEPPLTPAA
jgi:hypothetical protein